MVHIAIVLLVCFLHVSTQRKQQSLVAPFSRFSTAQVWQLNVTSKCHIPRGLLLEANQYMARRTLPSRFRGKCNFKDNFLNQANLDLATTPT
jgi:hypothetical protein